MKITNINQIFFFALTLAIKISSQATAVSFSQNVYANPIPQWEIQPNQGGFAEASDIVKSSSLISESTDSQRGAKTISILSSPGENTKALWDGIEINDPSAPAGAFNLSVINARQVQSVKLFVGVDTLEYSSGASGGVLAFDTRNYEEEKLAASLGYGAYHTNNAYLGFMGTTVSSESSEGWSTFPGATNEKDGFRRGDIYTKRRWDFGSTGSLRLVGGESSQVVDVDNFNSDNTAAQSVFKTRLAQANWLTESKNLNFKLNYFSNIRHESDSQTSTYNDIYKTQRYGAGATYNFYLTPQVPTKTGVELYQEILSAQNISQNEFHNQFNHTNLWIKGTWSPQQSSGTFTPAARASCKNGDDCSTEYGIKGQWKANRLFDFVADWTHNEHKPSWFQLWSPTFGEKSLQAEKSNRLQVGWVAQNWRIDYLLHSYQNQIVYTSKYENVGRSSIAGFTSQLFWGTLFSQTLSLNYLESRNDLNKTDLPYRPRWTLAHTTTSSLTSNLQWQSKIKAQSAQETWDHQKIGGLGTLDFRLIYKFSNLKTAASLSDISLISDKKPDNYSTKPTTWYLELSWDFS